jgi:DNA polymerase III epsilon subunit-like protein
MNYLFFDTETSGLPIMNGRTFFDYNMLDKYDNSRLVSLSYVITNDKNDILRVYDKIIKPTNFTISNESYQIHKISQQQALKDGINIKNVLFDFLNDLRFVDVVIGHNVNFDKNIILSENVRNEFSFDLQKELVTKNSICTAQMSKDKFGKYYRLKELNDLLNKNDKSEENYHNSLFDTMVCRNCYFAMKNM